jgi:hypothetical protein
VAHTYPCVSFATTAAIILSSIHFLPTTPSKSQQVAVTKLGFQSLDVKLSAVEFKLPATWPGDKHQRRRSSHKMPGLG